jgi:hypothetical protein
MTFATGANKQGQRLTSAGPFAFLVALPSGGKVFCGLFCCSPALGVEVGGGAFSSGEREAGKECSRAATTEFAGKVLKESDLWSRSSSTVAAALTPG